MNVTLIALATITALAAAARSTWSPCGQSMLSQINPIAETGRGQRYGRTAGWFIVGAVIGGMTIGGVAAGLASVTAAVGLGHRSALAIAAACALVSAAIDAGTFGFAPPFLRRQVNEDWLSRYRPWVYGGGFGWQIGVGLTTYVMTAAVLLTIVFAVLTANPWVALSIGALFGLARGVTVLLSAPLRTQADLYAFHRRFAAAGERVRQAVIAVQLSVAVIASWMGAPAPTAAVLTAGAVALMAWSLSRRRSSTLPAERRRFAVDAPVG